MTKINTNSTLDGENSVRSSLIQRMDNTDLLFTEEILIVRGNSSPFHTKRLKQTEDKTLSPDFFVDCGVITITYSLNWCIACSTMSTHILAAIEEACKIPCATLEAWCSESISVSLAPNGVVILDDRHQNQKIVIISHPHLRSRSRVRSATFSIRGLHLLTMDLQVLWGATEFPFTQQNEFVVGPEDSMVDLATSFIDARPCCGGVPW